MEKPIIRGCCSCSCIRKGVDVTPNPSSWESFGDVCSDVFGCLNSTGPCGRRLIVHFSLSGTQIHIDIGNVKAASVLCVLGISFGIGTYVLYKIYNKFVRPSLPRRRRKRSSQGEETGKNDLCETKEHEEMGNQQSSPVDIPVYYKAGFGVSLYKPIDRESLRNRKSGTNVSATAKSIIKGNLLPKNGLIAVENSNGESEVREINDRNIQHSVPDLNQLRIEIDESGFVDEDLEANGDKLSNSLKGNFSPTSLCEKNFRIAELDEALTESKEAKDSSEPKFDHLTLGPNLGSSSVLLTPPSEDESSSSSRPLLSSVQISHQSTKSDVSDIHSELTDLQQLGTDDEREQLSPLPYDKSTHSTPEKVSPRKLRLKLDEIVFRSRSHSLNSSTCTSPEYYSFGHSRTGSFKFEKENSISGVSSPELELLNSETAEQPAVNTGTFIHLEDEIHVVEDEFESISQEIQALTNRYTTNEIEIGSDIFKEIFLRYPSIRVRQSERGIQYPVSESDGSVNMDEDKDLSWDLENVMDIVYSEGSDSVSVSQALTNRMRVVGGKLELPDTSVNVSPLSNNSVNCSVDLGGSMYEDEFHLHLGTKALPKIDELSPDPEICDKIPSGQYTSQHRENDHTYTRPETSHRLENNLASTQPETSHHLENDLASTQPETSHHLENDLASTQPETSEHLENDLASTQPEASLASSEPINSQSEDLHSDLLEQFFSMSGTSQSFDQTGSSSLEHGTSHTDNNHSDSRLGTSQQDNGYGSLEPNHCDEQREECRVGLESEIGGLCSPVSLSVLCNIGDRQTFMDYADSEWRGDTPRAQLIREAYRAIPTHCRCCHLRRIRGDNYCGVRGTVFQTLVNRLPPFNIWASKDEALQHLSRAYNNKSSGILKWNFAHRISYTKENQLEIMQRCLSTLYAKINEMSQHSIYTAREQCLVNSLNSDLHSDLDLMEGVKLLMLLGALHLHSNMEQGMDVPVFAWLLFARDTSENMSSFVRNHLNQVGNSGGLEQVEMCLLGYSLGVRIRVFRLQHFGDEDFISYYPDDGTDSWPVVSLVAEDDRHYNVPVL